MAFLHGSGRGGEWEGECWGPERGGGGNLRGKSHTHLGSLLQKKLCVLRILTINNVSEKEYLDESLFGCPFLASPAFTLPVSLADKDVTCHTKLHVCHPILLLRLLRTQENVVGLLFYSFNLRRNYH